MPTLLTAPELAALLKLPVARIYRLAREGQLPHFKVGRSVRFDHEAVLESMKHPCWPHRERDRPKSSDLAPV